MEYETVLAFWFNAHHESYWFKQNDGFDEAIRDGFYDSWEAARHGELSAWRKDIRGRLAEIIVLDQFSRNLHRDSALAWQQDGMALLLAQEAVKTPGYASLNLDEKGFLLMPWMHAESRVIHQQAEVLFDALKGSSYYQSELEHRQIIEVFGRYPHRNQRLNRPSTPAEQAFLNERKRSFY